MTTTLPEILLPACAAGPLAAGLLTAWGGVSDAGRAARAGALTALLCAAAAGVLHVAAGGAGPVFFAPGGSPLALLRLDGVSALMAVLVSFVGLSVLRFCRRALEGMPGESRFYRNLSLCLGSVLVLVLAENLLVLAAAWISTSLCLHALLLHDPSRREARLSAWKKFFISRAGDLCLLAAGAELWRAHGTLRLQSLIDAVAAGGGVPASAAVLLVLCAMLKSAQVPFHTWLPDTLETPTPVSAFMHAGIVNAGGFLVIRLAPLVAAQPPALLLLAAGGALTTLVGALTMMTQTSVKRRLAYSTIAQMGFMMLECGLGLFGVALLHLAAHSLYKAYAFLRAGEAVRVSRVRPRRVGLAGLAGGLAAALVSVWAAGRLVGVVAGHPVAEGPVALLLTLVAAYAYAQVLAMPRGERPLLPTLAAVPAACAVALALHAGASSLPGLVGRPAPGAEALATACFVALFSAQAALPMLARHPLGGALRVHALNGFYLGTLARRWAGRLPMVARQAR